MKTHSLFLSLYLLLTFNALKSTAAVSMSTFFDSVPQAPTDAVLGLSQGKYRYDMFYL